MTAPNPSVPNWQSILTSSVKTKKPTDIWSLGHQYGEPILLGTTPAGNGPAGADLGMGEGSTSHPTTDTKIVTAQTQKLMNQVATLWSTDPASYVSLQNQLAKAGYFGKKEDYVPGRWDSATQSALRHALQDYVKATRMGGGAPVTFSEFVSQNAASTEAYLKQLPAAALQAKKDAMQVRVDDPGAIRAAFTAAFQAATGRAPKDSEAISFVNEFQNQQRQYELSTNKTVTAPDLSAQAMSAAQQDAPGEFQQHNEDAYTNALLDMFLPSASQRPGMTPVAPA